MVYLFLTLERSVDAGSFAFPPLTPRKQTHKRKFHIAVFEPLSERNKSSHAPGGKALYKNYVCSLGAPSLAPFHPLITYAPVNLDLRRRRRPPPPPPRPPPPSPPFRPSDRFGRIVCALQRRKRNTRPLPSSLLPSLPQSPPLLHFSAARWKNHLLTSASVVKCKLKRVIHEILVTLPPIFVMVRDFL